MVGHGHRSPCRLSTLHFTHRFYISCGWRQSWTLVTSTAAAGPSDEKTKTELILHFRGFRKRNSSFYCPQSAGNVCVCLARCIRKTNKANQKKYIFLSRSRKKFPLWQRGINDSVTKRPETEFQDALHSARVGGHWGHITFFPDSYVTQRRRYHLWQSGTHKRPSVQEPRIASADSFFFFPKFPRNPFPFTPALAQTIGTGETRSNKSIYRFQTLSSSHVQTPQWQK